MRSKFVRFLSIALVALLLVVPLAGCSDDTDKANAAVEAANARVDEFNALDSEISGITDEIDALGDSEEDMAKTVELIDDATAKFEERGAAIEAVVAEYAKIGSMDVSENIKTYATQQMEVWELQAEVDGLAVEMLGKMKDLYKGLADGSLDDAATEKLREEIVGLSEDAKTQQGALDEKASASSDYFDENVK